MTENQHTGNPSARQALLDIAERCEREEPNDELNWSIMEAVRPDHGQTQATPYTASLDAAMTLVPEGAGITLERYWLRAGARWRATIRWGIKGAVAEAEDVATEACALCAAALRARAGEA